MQEYAKSDKRREYLREYDRARYANDSKRREAVLSDARRFRAENPGRMSHYAHKRRALVTAATIEEVDSWEVFSRDNWICGICGESVSPEIKFPEDMSPSLDHVIPISKGGEHSYSNTRLAHLVCNRRKGARLDG